MTAAVRPGLLIGPSGMRGAGSKVRVFGTARGNHWRSLRLPIRITFCRALGSVGRAAKVRNRLRNCIARRDPSDMHLSWNWMRPVYRRRGTGPR